MGFGRAAVITVGTELVEGLRTDTNGPTVARRLSAIGFTVAQTVSVRDDLAEIRDAVKALASSCELVVSTGGLGPTHDDVTREGAAEALGVALVEDASYAKLLEGMSAKVDDAGMRAQFLRQAQVLEGAELIRPVAGTAPAQVVATPAGQMLILPGPPHEMLPLFEAFVARFDSLQETSVDISCFGINETRVQRIVQPLIADEPRIVFTVLASAKECHVILADAGCGEEILHAKADAVCDALGDLVFSRTGESLGEVVVKAAIGRGMTLGCAESCTGGLVAGAITAVPGSSEAFYGGIVSYANAVKMGQLGVSADTLSTVGAVSEECAAQMAQGARRALGVDVAVSTTGIAGPGGGSDEKPVGTVCFGLATSQGVRTYRKLWRDGMRDAIRERSVSFALDLIRRELLGFDRI